LIGDNREPELVGVKIERAILVAHWNTDEFDLLDHNAQKLIGFSASRPQWIALLRQKQLSI